MVTETPTDDLEKEKDSRGPGAGGKRLQKPGGLQGGAGGERPGPSPCSWTVRRRDPTTARSATRLVCRAKVMAWLGEPGPATPGRGSQVTAEVQGLYSRGGGGGVPVRPGLQRGHLQREATPARCIPGRDCGPDHGLAPGVATRLRTELGSCASGPCEEGRRAAGPSPAPTSLHWARPALGLSGPTGPAGGGGSPGSGQARLWVGWWEAQPPSPAPHHRAGAQTSGGHTAASPASQGTDPRTRSNVPQTPNRKIGFL